MDVEALDAKTLSDVVVNAQPGELVRLRQTLRMTDRFRGQPAGSSWKTVQASFLDRILPRNSPEIASRKAPIFNLKTDRELQQQLKKVFNPTELTAIERNVDLIERIVLDRPGSGALSGRQAGAVMRGLYTAGAGVMGLYGCQ